MAEHKIIANNGSSIVLYTTEGGNTQLEVKLENDSVWLNREQIAQLYERDYKTIAKHINNALREELEGEPVVAKFATPKKYGRKEGYTQMQNVDYYNLDMIISVEYRVKSRNGIVFRKWANNILKQYRKQVNCTIISVWVQVFAKSRKLHLGAMAGSKN